ncbi:lectin subunit alpha-like [Calliphora vicina]|uniref:lectin subunit alpha-like n=1 Tax=Calliphora vicina TaxID=7373 RepID=UPI00325BD464
MKCTVCILFIINLAFGVSVEKWQESEDGSRFYIEAATKYNWFEALSECARKNMSLIAIDTSEKHQQIDNLLKRLYTSSPSFWIGGHDNAVHLRFEWISTGEPFAFTNWGPKQPATKDKNEHCLLMWSDFKWHDYYCHYKVGYICEENQLVKNVYHVRKFNQNGTYIGGGKNYFFYFHNGN